MLGAVLMPDGGLAITGEYIHHSGGDGFFAFLMRTNLFGDTLWNRRYRKDVGAHRSFSTGSEVAVTNSNEIVMIATTHGDTLYTPYGYIVKTSADGDSLWTLTYGDVTTTYFYTGTVSSSSGNVIVVSNKPNDGAILSVTPEGRLDQLGSIPNPATIQDICENGDGFVTLGYGPGGIAASRVGDFGIALWTKYYAGHEGEAVAKTPDGGFILAGNVLPPNDPYTDILLIRINDAGDTIWTRSYPMIFMQKPRDVVALADGSVVLCGYTDDPYLQAFIMKTDSQGNVMWFRRYSNCRQLKFCTATIDGGFMFAGTKSYQDKRNDVYILKTDSLGLVKGINTQ